jgi:hypothetical protein
MRAVAQTTPLLPHRAAKKRAARPRAARQERPPLWTPGGRAWINGREVGGTDPRFAHLNRSYD